MRLEKEFKKGREQSDTLSKELLEARREAAQCSKEAQESLTMMTDMRKAHIMEVRLLQRGLAQRGGDAASRNKVNEVADLVDKVGRAVVQRDEAIRDKTKMQVNLTKAITDCRNLADEAAKLKRNNRELTAQLKEALRKAKFNVPKAERNVPEDSDEEFEHELAVFEKRFEILEEGPAGLDILASNLSKDKQTLEKRLKAAQETNKSLSSSVENWKRLGEEKDLQIEELSAKLDKMMKDHAALQEAIAQKRREIELQVQEEKEALNRRIEELELECDNARAVADGMEKASSRLTKELVKVHETYTGQQAAKAEDAAASQEPTVLAQTEQPSKTGESLKLEVKKTAEGAIELHASEAGGELTVIQIDDALTKELDQEAPWTDLFSRVGVSPGPPRQIVVAGMLERDTVKLQPDNAEVILTIHRFDDRRFLLSALNLATQSSMELVLNEDTITAELGAKLDGCQGQSRALFECLSSHIMLQADGTQLALA